MIKTIIEENILETPIYPMADLVTEKKEEEETIDLTSAVFAMKPLEFIDNNSNHTRTSLNETYRITDYAHNLESHNSLEVDEIMPTLSVPSGDFGVGVGNTVKIKTPLGASEFTYSIKENNNKFSCFTFTGTVGDVTISVPLPRELYHDNNYGEYADISRAIYMLLFRCLNISFRPAKNEENAFKKLIEYLNFK